MPLMPTMPSPSPLDQITERVELLLARHAVLQRSNAQLSGMVAALSLERDSLQERLRAARTRIDTLVGHLEAATAALEAAAPEAADALNSAAQDGACAAAARPAPDGASPLPPKEEHP